MLLFLKERRRITGYRLRKVLWEEAVVQVRQLSQGNASTEITKSLREPFLLLIDCYFNKHWTSKVSKHSPYTKWWPINGQAII